MTKKEFLKLPIWNRIPDNAEIIGTVFSMVKHLDDRKRVKRVKSGGIYEMDADVRLIYSSHNVKETDSNDQG
jgi:hypothetical protein